MSIGNESEQKQFWDMTVQAPIVEKAVGYVHSGRALDLGSGEGRNAMYLAEQGFDVLAVDTDKVALDVLAKRSQEESLNLRTQSGDVLDFQSNETFNYIVCNMVLHFLKSQEEVHSVITKMQNMTNTGGVNVIAAYTDKNEPNKRPYLFKPNELKDFYSGWDILFYEEKPTLWFQMPNEEKPRRNQAVYLIAQKSSK